MRVIFRADASLQIGTGHVMRCLTLAEALRKKGAICHFICREHPGNLLELIRQRGFDERALPVMMNAKHLERESEVCPNHMAWLGADWQTDAMQTLDVIGQSHTDWLIVDHYALDARWEQIQRTKTRKIMVIDDLADRTHDCDILLDQNVGRTEAHYSALVPSNCTILTGARYVLLRPEFSELREYSLTRRSRSRIKSILVTMGGVDKCNATGEVLTALKKASLPTDCLITVVMGEHAPWLAAVRDQAKQMPCKTTVLVNVRNMAQLMAECDLAIGAGGGTTYERIFMGLPAILKPIAENQRTHLVQMAKIGLFEIYDSSEELLEKLGRILKKGGVIPSDVVDNGTPVVCELLMRRRVELRKPKPLDLRRTFFWLQNEELRKQFLMREKPSRKMHFSYWKNLLRGNGQYIFSIYFDDAHVGNAGIKNIKKMDDEAELWLYLGEGRFHGKGIGRETLLQLERFVKEDLEIDRVVLHVGKWNQRACKLYSAAGYGISRDDDSSSLYFNDNSIIKMEKRI